MKRLTQFIAMFCFLVLGANSCGDGKLESFSKNQSVDTRIGAESFSTDQSVEAKMGKWSNVIQLPVIPGHTHLLPDGQLLFWDLGMAPRPLFTFNPKNNSSEFVTESIYYDLGCSAHSFLRDGRLLIVGGHGNISLALKTSFIYDPYNKVLSQANSTDMNDGRWYGTNVTLGDGTVMAASGAISDFQDPINNATRYNINEESQVYDPNLNSWRNLPNLKHKWSLYPMMHLLSDGRIFNSGPERGTFFIDTSNNGSLIPGPSRESDSYEGTSLLYGPNKIIVIGGETELQLEDNPVVSSNVEIIDLNVPSPVWRKVASLPRKSAYHNATLLPDGKILVTGGSESPDRRHEGHNTPDEILEARIFNPETETWETLAPQKIARKYHSTALLLPDGRVFSGGGGHEAIKYIYFNFNAEIFSPPYLFGGPRPSIKNGPSKVTWGEKIMIETAEASDIKRVTLIRNSSVTHSTNMDQRFSELEFTLNSNNKEELSVTIPSNPNVVPPGPYMLFILDQKGIPSEAKMILVN